MPTNPNSFHWDNTYLNIIRNQFFTPDYLRKGEKNRKIE